MDRFQRLRKEDKKAGRCTRCHTRPARIWRTKCVECSPTKGREPAKHRLELKYGITLRDYEKLMAKQDGVCAICRKPPHPKRKLAVDHDHKTGEVRGLLCGSCNPGLGYFKDSVTRLKAAIAYLSEYGELAH